MLSLFLEMKKPSFCPEAAVEKFAEFPEVVAIESQNTIAKPGSISGALL